MIAEFYIGYLQVMVFRFFLLDNSSCPGITSDASFLMPALYCLTVFGIDALLLSSIVEIITL